MKKPNPIPQLRKLQAVQTKTAELLYDLGMMPYSEALDDDWYVIEGWIINIEENAKIAKLEGKK